MEGHLNLVLAGFMGTGKSTVGRLAAARLGRPFVDTDDLIVEQAGMPVKDIFARYGEPHFRELERQVCLKVAEQQGLVVATGGGALLNAGSRRALEATGVVVLLHCDTTTLLARLESSARRGERPLLEGDYEARIIQLLRERNPIYSSLPLSVDTTSLRPRTVAGKVLALYRQAVEHGVAV